MDHHGQLALRGQLKMPIEVVLLEVKRRVVPVAVQSRFAQGHYPTTIGHRHDPLPVVPGRLAGLGQPQRGPAGIGRDADADHGFHACLPAAGNYRVTIGVELFLIEMEVRVDVGHGRVTKAIDACGLALTGD